MNNLKEKCLSDIINHYNNRLNSDDAARAVINNLLESSLLKRIAVQYGFYTEPFIFLANGRSAFFYQNCYQLWE